MDLMGRLGATLRIQPGEGRLVSLVLAYGYLLGLGRTFCAAAVSGMFLALFGAEALPYTFIGAALAVPITGVIYLRLRERLPLARLIAWAVGLLIVALLSFRAALAVGQPPPLVFALMISYTIVYVLVSLSFWGLAGQLFNVRQGKRLFGLLGSGSEVADISGGLLTLALAPLIGASNLLFLAAGGLSVALLVERAIVRRYPLSADQPDDEEHEPAPGVAEVLRGGFVRAIFLMLALSQIAYFLVENSFYDLATTHFAGAEQLSALVGATVAASSILTIFLQVTAAGPLVSRFGVRGGLPVLPVFLLIGGAAVAISGAALGPAFAVFVLMLVVRVVERALRFSVDESAVQIAYQPIPAAQRSLVQTVVDGGVKPLAAGVAGALILVCTQLLGMGGVGLAGLLATVAGLWLAVALAVGRGYGAALMSALSRRRLSATNLNLQDAESLAIVERGLRSPHAGEALYALQLLDELGHPGRDAALAVLLEHPQAAVRRAALERIERLRPVELAPAVRAALGREDDPGARGQALRALASLGAIERGELAAALDDPAPETRIGATAALARLGESDLAAAWMRAMAAGEPAERALVARAAAVAGGAGDVELLARLLDDPDPRVRRAALAAVPTAGAPELWPAVVAALAVPALRAAARSALAAGGAEAVPALRATFAQPGQGSAQRLQIVRACGRLGPAAAELLLDAIETPDEELRHAVAAALERCGYRAEGAAAERLQRQIAAEASHGAWVLAARRDLGDGEATAELRAALESAAGRARERILAMFAPLSPREPFARARAGLEHPSGERRAYAVEALDMLLPQSLRPLVLPLVEAPAEALPQLERRFPQPPRRAEERIAEIIAAGERVHPWVQACARYAAARANGAAPPEAALVEQVQLLKGGLIFADVPTEELLAVATLLRPARVAAGAPIFARGDTADCVYLIAGGRVRFHDGERTLNELGPRELFGEVAVLDARPRALSATAVEPTELLRLEREALLELIAEHVSVARGIIRVLIRNLRVNLRELGAIELQLQALQGAQN